MTPAVQLLSIYDEGAFPAFKLSPLSSAWGSSDPVLGHEDHFKFYLLRTHCNGVVQQYGAVGRVIHQEPDFNELGMAALLGQQQLLVGGFQSTFEKLKELCETNGHLLDGRTDLERNGSVFDPPEARFKHSGSASAVVTGMKKGVIDTLQAVSDVGTNFRLAQLMQKFKTHCNVWEYEHWEQDGDFISTPSLGSASKKGPLGPTPLIDPREYILQTSEDGELELFRDFDSLFAAKAAGTPRHEAAKLDVASMCKKKDFDEVRNFSFGFVLTR